MILVVTGDSLGGFSVRTAADLSAELKRSEQKAIRSSPIFPVIPAKASPVPLQGRRHIVYLCPIRSLEFIRMQTTPVQEKLWFSHGAASVLYFCENRAEFEPLINETALSAYEIWTVDASGKLELSEPWLRPISVPDVRLSDFSSLDKDAQRLLQEVEYNLYEAGRVAAQFTPELVPRLQRIVLVVNGIVDELVFFKNPSAPVPAHFRGDVEALKRDKFALHQRINQGLTQLIQLNSALAYSISQAICGAVPVLERPCLVAAYSLLGVGTAYRALAAMCSFIEDVFERLPVLRAIELAYKNGKPIEVFPLVYRYAVREWKNAGYSIDSYLIPGLKEEISPKLTYFSARLGFAEAHFSVTAATQVLSAADSTRWSLMTLTHELLHAHVRGILSTILGESAEIGMSEITFREFHAAFLRAVKDAQREKPFAPSNPMDSLRYMIFSFANARASALEQPLPDAQTENPAGAAELPIRVAEDFDDFKAEFRSALKLWEEVVVHTLDLRYFYAGDQDLFLELLWASWTTVPAVVGDIDTYLLRSTAASAFLETGTAKQRFTASTHRLQKVLDKLIAAQPENEFLRKAKSHLSTKKSHLWDLFTPMLYAADMTATFLASAKIEGALWGDDENIDESDGGRLGYALATGDFKRGDVKNPIPFIADRLRRQASDNEGLDEDYRSAWLLLAAASAASSNE